jgi:hypothetical protein
MFAHNFVQQHFGKWFYFPWFLLAIIACSNTGPAYEIEPAQLLIDLSIMPSDWYVVSKGDPVDNIRQVDGAAIWFNGNTTQDLIVASHRVYRYRNVSRAAKEFERQITIEFNSSSVASSSPWQPPTQLPYVSPVADDFYFACHISAISGKTTCQFMGVYRNYLVIFHTHIVPNYMEYDDLKIILETIDERMSEHLK